MQLQRDAFHCFCQWGLSVPVTLQEAPTQEDPFRALTGRVLTPQGVFRLGLEHQQQTTCTVHAEHRRLQRLWWPRYGPQPLCHSRTQTSRSEGITHIQHHFYHCTSTPVP